MTEAFASYALPAAGNPFEALHASVSFEVLGKGRQGAVLLAPDETGGIPIVRTTTLYARPAQCFRSLHARLAAQIRACASLSCDFNNALIETYSKAYTTMGSHSDQALDLAQDSSIAIFSCYRDPASASPPRKLIVAAKQPGGESFEIPLSHNHVIVFSLETNRRFRHKIVLDAPPRSPENHWLGITFRRSKTSLSFRDAQPRLPDGTPLSLASEEQRREFYQLRRRENQETDFSYPRIGYSISPSDLIPPATPGT